MTAPEQPTPLQAAREAVEALPSHLFDRSRTEEIAANLASDFEERAVEAVERVRPLCAHCRKNVTGYTEEPDGRRYYNEFCAECDDQEEMATPPPGDAAVIIGNFTINKLRNAETVEVNGIALIPADDLREPPGDAGERTRPDIEQQALEIIHATNEWIGSEAVPSVKYRAHLQLGITAALQSYGTAAASQAREERDDLQRTFDLQWEADQHAIKRWQEAHPGNDMVWPDRANMVMWLMEQHVSASQARREGAEAMREACAQCCRSWIISDRAGETATKIEKRIRALANPQERDDA